MRVECCIQVKGCKRVNKSRLGMQQHISVQKHQVAFPLKEVKVIYWLYLCPSSGPSSPCEGAGANGEFTVPYFHFFLYAGDSSIVAIT